ncbi:MAG TPA: adenylate/guanylate cyclase domain-containing protein, partial [Polyangiales bacterium]|nr:adenylate/guanylate cyclase domain-containing protein [Polyangiales bacterium]
MDAPIEGQRRFVSLLFADVCDYTALSESADPEEIQALRRSFERLASEVIARRGGVVSQLYGDGMLAVFGLEGPHEDDARRAVDAALELHEAMRQLPSDRSWLRDHELRLHTGIHAGVVFSRRGDELHGRYDLTGDAVNTAARLCGAAGRDEVLVSRAALRGFEAYFVAREAAPLTLRNKSVPVPAHFVSARSGLPTSFEART